MNDINSKEQSAAKQERLKKQAKNSIFMNLFMRPEHQLQLYRELYPQDTSFTQDSIELVTLESDLAIHPCNDLGLLTKDKLIVLAEAQSTWSVYTIYRLADSYYDSAANYLKSCNREIPAIELFVIYTGRQQVEKDVLSLNQEFFGGDPNKPFKARIIHGEYKKGIIQEYMEFCRIWEENNAKASTLDEKQQQVASTIDQCIEKGYLAKYLSDNRLEANKIMLEMFSPEYVKTSPEQVAKIQEAITFARYLGIPDNAIKTGLISRYNLTSICAQDFLDDTPSQF